jgi:predicted metal-dependent hydrolase
MPLRRLTRLCQDTPIVRQAEGSTVTIRPSKEAAAQDTHVIGEFAGRVIRVRLIVDARAKRIGLRIDPARREAVAITPTKRAAAQALAFARERAHWIAQQLQRLPTPAPFTPGAHIPYVGAQHELVWALGRARAEIAAGSPPRLIVAAPDEALFSARVARFLKVQAKEALSQAVEKHSQTLGVRASRLTVKDTKSRWGSCSSDKALAFSWRVILAPPAVLDYLAAHEVAHLVEMNHSPRFWALVERCRPDFRIQRAWLKQNGLMLHAVGKE